MSRNRKRKSTETELEKKQTEIKNQQKLKSYLDLLEIVKLHNIFQESKDFMLKQFELCQTYS